jgi:hypothetical protein
MNQVTRVLREITANILMGVPLFRKWRSRAGRASSRQLETQLISIRQKFEFFMRTLGSVEGKTIVEIGPGDDVGLGALFLKAGAKRYVAFDRFPGNVFGSYAKQIYDRLGCGDLDLGRGISFRAVAIEDVNAAQEEAADVIVTFNALASFRDSQVAIGTMTKLLKPDGVMIHRVNYGPMGVWTDCRNKLEFLGVREWLWQLMGSNRGYLSRVRHIDIERMLQERGFKMHSRVCYTHAREDLQNARAWILERFRSYPDEDVLPWIVEFSCSRAHAPALGAECGTR